MNSETTPEGFGKLSKSMEEVRCSVMEQGMVNLLKVTGVSGRGSGGTSDQAGVSAHMDGVSVSAIGISASKVSAPCHSIKCHAGAYPDRKSVV